MWNFSWICLRTFSATRITRQMQNYRYFRWHRFHLLVSQKNKSDRKVEAEGCCCTYLNRSPSFLLATPLWPCASMQTVWSGTLQAGRTSHPTKKKMHMQDLGILMAPAKHTCVTERVVLSCNSHHFSQQMRLYFGNQKLGGQNRIEKRLELTNCKTSSVLRFVEVLCTKGEGEVYCLLQLKALWSG